MDGRKPTAIIQSLSPGKHHRAQCWCLSYTFGQGPVSQGSPQWVAAQLDVHPQVEPPPGLWFPLCWRVLALGPFCCLASLPFSGNEPFCFLLGLLTDAGLKLLGFTVYVLSMGCSPHATLQPTEHLPLHDASAAGFLIASLVSTLCTCVCVCVH